MYRYKRIVAINVDNFNNFHVIKLKGNSQFVAGIVLNHARVNLSKGVKI